MESSDGPERQERVRGPRIAVSRPSLCVFHSTLQMELTLLVRTARDLPLNVWRDGFLQRLASTLSVPPGDVPGASKLEELPLGDTSVPLPAGARSPG